ncbi:MAG: sigma-70 family RNA polymerase sigma factor [Planctomycetes bacterium]|nr:sigma-70 family RNA polymerase sigma factor [Planctomycetota bacterium]
MAAGANFDSEQPVIEAIQQGDHYAFRELLRRHDRWVRGIVFGVLGRHDAVDDVVQQVWTSVWEKISDLRDTSRWKVWLYRLARNAAVDAGRAATKDRERNSALPDGLADAVGHDPAAERSAEEQRQAMLRAIEALPALYREPLTLRHLEGWSYRQIAEVLDAPIDTIETRLVRARRLLRKALVGEFEQEA